MFDAGSQSAFCYLVCCSEVFTFFLHDSDKGSTMRILCVCGEFLIHHVYGVKHYHFLDTSKTIKCSHQCPHKFPLCHI